MAFVVLCKVADAEMKKPGDMTRAQIDPAIARRQAMQDDAADPVN